MGVGRHLLRGEDKVKGKDLRRGLSLGAALLLSAAAFALDAPPPLPVNDVPAEATSSPAPSVNPFSRQKEPPQTYPRDPAIKSHAAELCFGIPIPEGNEAVEKKRAEYLSSGGLAWIQAVLKRAVPYWAYVNGRIAFYGLPPELAYLPVIESEYRPTGISRTGAAGIWQFMRNSIGGSGIKIDDWRDDRRDFVKSTEAALKKLKWNYEHYGDWYLALAAYNCGVGKLDRAIKKAGTSDYWELCAKKAIPSETRTYVPKLLAIASIARYGGRYGMAPSWDDPVEWEHIPLQRSVHLSLVAEKANVPLDLLKSGNAELRYNVTPPGDKSYCLKVPAGYGQAVSDVVNDASLKLIKYYIYTVKYGDTLSALSRHYDVSVDMIMSNNPGLQPRALRLGAKIIVPAMKDVGPYQGAKPAGDDSAPAFTATYRVCKGDTIWSLALKYGVQPETLAERNGLSLDSIIHEGLILSVPRIN
jgi:membrane-bound lytic murein transglycosylase D